MSVKVRVRRQKLSGELFRKDLHASFLARVSSLDIDNPQSSGESQADFDYFYKTALQLLNQFCPERTISVTSRDTEYITPASKASLCRKNRLMRTGGVEEAGALAQRISKDIANRSKSPLNKISGRVDSKDM